MRAQSASRGYLQMMFSIPNVYFSNSVVDVREQGNASAPLLRLSSVPVLQGSAASWF